MIKSLTTIKNNENKNKNEISNNSNYLSIFSLVHAYNLYNDDDKAILQSLNENENNNENKNKNKKILLHHMKIQFDDDWLISQSNKHTNYTIRDDDTLITQSINHGKN
jgi:hypothetical protein